MRFVDGSLVFTSKFDGLWVFKVVNLVYKMLDYHNRLVSYLLCFIIYKFEI